MSAAGKTAAAWWQLLRAGNVWTAVSNILAGFLLVRGQWQPVGPLLALIAASVLLYEAGMVLNDVFDAARDALERPERPIPSGRIARGVALRLGLGLLATGWFFAWLASLLSGQATPWLIGLLLVVAIVGYDAGLKATWSGPIAMGLCRSLNVLLGASVAPHLIAQPAVGVVAVGVGIYTCGLTWFARREAQTSGRRDLLLGGLLLGGGLAVVAWLPALRAILPSLAVWIGVWLLLLATVGGLIFRAISRPTPKTVQRAIKTFILLFIVVDAVVCWAVAGWVPGLVVLSLLVPTLLIARRTPMT